MARPQNTLSIESFHKWDLPDGTPWTEFYRTQGGYLLRFQELADFEIVTDAQQVTCYPVPDVLDETIQHLYLNQVLPLVLNKLGKLVVHGSAVEITDGAIAFVGESGRGKSTLAASFAVSGFRFLTDDGLVVEPTGSGFQAQPSHPSLRLWEDSEEAVITSDTEKAPALCFTSKSRFLAGDSVRFCDQPRLLRRVYFLGDGSAEYLMFEPLSGTEAMLELVKHSFLMDINEKPRLASHFDQVAKLAKQPIHFRLDYPRRFEDLPDIRRAILEHALEGEAVAWHYRIE